MTDKQALKKWEQVAANIRKLKSVKFETPEAKAIRIEGLKKDFVAFSQYYFPEYASADFAKFHLQIANKLIKNNKIYLVAALAREHGKSVLLGLLLPAYLMFTKRMYNMLLVSHNKDNAEELLMPLILNLEFNQRIINDFGVQKGFRTWEKGNWCTKEGCSFRAIGAGQSPRGTRNEEKRPDLILIDDIDTDEESRNQTRIDNKWKWIEQALFPTMSISGSKRFIFAGNIIAKEGCIVKASRVADFFIKVNILDKDGNPSWGRYSLEDVNYMLSKISYASQQKEYFNNPIQEGAVFKEMVWGKVPRLNSFNFLVAYGDPSPSNKESKSGSDKSVFLLGEKNGKYYIINGFCKTTTNATFIEWYHDLKDYVNGRALVYNYMENNSLQDPFYEQVYQPLMIAINKRKGSNLFVLPDQRKKPDKFTRIEGNLEPAHRIGALILNQAEKNNPHMKRLEEQFKAVEPALGAKVDGVDCIEGGKWIIDHKLKVFEVSAGSKKRSSKKY